MQPIKLNNAVEASLKSPGFSSQQYEQALKSPGFVPLQQQALKSPGFPMDAPLKSPAFPPQEPPMPSGNVGYRVEQYQEQSGAEKPINDDSASLRSGAAPGQAQFMGAMATTDTVGTFNGGSYRISHRDTNTILIIQLAKLAPLHAKPGEYHSPRKSRSLIDIILGVMIAMSPTVTLKGAVKFSLKKLVTGSELASSEYKGPGEIVFAPSFLGDITSLRLTGTDEWRVGKDAFIASTTGVNNNTKRQGIGKAVYSGEGLFTYLISGSGIAWIASFGAIVQKEVGVSTLKLFPTLTSIYSFNPKNNISSITVTL